MVLKTGQVLNLTFHGAILCVLPTSCALGSPRFHQQEGTPKRVSASFNYVAVFKRDTALTKL